MKKIIFLVGPTAVGKTDISIYLAKLLNAEIVSCDSMQVYKGMDIGTQKPAQSQKKAVIHHMIDIISPERIFSVSGFREKAAALIDKIHAKGKIPLFTGGTALYMKILVDGLFASPPADELLRKELMKKELEEGKGFLHKKLAGVDAPTAKMLHPNDARRIIRALEVYEMTGIPMSELKKDTKGLWGKYNIRIFCLNRQRGILYKRIDSRVDAMFKKGLVAECKRLRKKRLSLTARQALGYKEVFSYLDGKSTLAEAKELVKQNTRHFAKRQLSWFRNDKRIEWVDVDDKTPEEAAAVIARLVKPAEVTGKVVGGA